MKYGLLIGAAVVGVAGAIAYVAGTPAPATCVMRPRGAAVDSCLRRIESTNDTVPSGLRDWGEENAMPASEAVGDGCVATPCRVTQ